MFNFGLFKQKKQIEEPIETLNVYTREEFINEGHPTERDIEFTLMTLGLPASASFEDLDGISNPKILQEYLASNYDDLKILYDKLGGIPEPATCRTEFKPYYFCYHKEHGIGVVGRWGKILGLWVMFLKNMRGLDNPL